MKGHQADHPIATVCRVLGLSPSGYYACHQRAPSARDQRDAELTMQLRALLRELCSELARHDTGRCDAAAVQAFQCLDLARLEARQIAGDFLLHFFVRPQTEERS